MYIDLNSCLKCTNIYTYTRYKYNCRRRYTWLHCLQNICNSSLMLRFAKIMDKIQMNNVNASYYIIHITHTYPIDHIFQSKVNNTCCRQIDASLNWKIYCCTFFSNFSPAYNIWMKKDYNNKSLGTPVVRLLSRTYAFCGYLSEMTLLVWFVGRQPCVEIMISRA